MDARAARVHAALQLQHSLEALRTDFDARFGDLAEKRTTASDAPSQLWAYVARKHRAESPRVSIASTNSSTEI